LFIVREFTFIHIRSQFFDSILDRFVPTKCHNPTSLFDREELQDRGNGGGTSRQISSMA
jgi:hypothetical protein